MPDPSAALDRVWRSDAGSMLGVLTRRLGELDRAEEALQDAVGEALRRWPEDGVPGGRCRLHRFHDARQAARLDIAGRKFGR